MVDMQTVREHDGDERALTIARQTALGEAARAMQAEMQAEMQVEVQELAAAPHEVAAITGTPSIEDLVPFDLRVDEAEAEADSEAEQKES